MTLINIFFCLVYTTVATIIALRKIQNPDHDPTFVLLIASRLCIGALQVTSFVFLLLGAYRIQKHIKGYNVSHLINTKMMSLHVVAVSLYLVSGIGYYIALIWFLNTEEFENSNAEKHTIIWNTCVCVCTFLAQGCQFFIFKSLDDTETQVIEEDTGFTLETEEDKELEKSLQVSGSVHMNHLKCTAAHFLSTLSNQRQTNFKKIGSVS